MMFTINTHSPNITGQMTVHLLFVWVLALNDVDSRGISYLMQDLNPIMPVLPIGFSRSFWAIACVHLGASPNKYLIYRFSVYIIVYSVSKEKSTFCISVTILIN